MAETGILIAIEGIDGAGKTTQVERLKESLEAAGERVLTSKEPTDGQHGQELRRAAVEGRLSAEDEIRLFIQDRVEHVETRINPALEEGKVVILDRYFYSTIAYQGARTGDIERLDAMMRDIAPTPDVAFVLDVEPAAAIARVMSRDGQPSAFERLDTLTEVRAVFLQLQPIDPAIVVIDSSQSRERVEDEMLAALLQGPLYEKRCEKMDGCDDHYHCTPRILGNCTWWKLRNTFYERLKVSHPEALDMERMARQA